MVARCCFQNRIAINQLSGTAAVVQGLRAEVETLVLRAKFEISEHLHSDESKSRNKNINCFGELTRAQQKMYDSKIEKLEKQMVGMQQHFSQIVGQFSQKIDALIAENSKIRLETAARPPPCQSPSAKCDSACSGDFPIHDTFTWPNGISSCHPRER